MHFMTVSRAINTPERVADETRERILRAIEETGYVPNLIGRGLRVARSRVIGLVLAGLEPYALQTLRGVTRTARARGYSVLVAHSESSTDIESEQLTLMRSQRVEGVVLLPHAENPANAHKTQAAGTHVVVVSPTVGPCAVDQVRGETRPGVQAMTRYLIGECGHRELYMLSGPDWSPSARERELGFTDALRAASLDPEGHVVRGDYSIATGYDAAMRVLRERPETTAIVAASDMIARGASAAARELGLRVPDDLSIASVGEVGDLYGGAPFFTTASQPLLAIAGAATDLLLDRIEGIETGPRREVVVDASVEVHRSTGRVRG